MKTRLVVTLLAVLWASNLAEAQEYGPDPFSSSQAEISYAAPECMDCSYASPWGTTGYGGGHTYWFRSEYLLMWFKQGYLPPVVGEASGEFVDLEGEILPDGAIVHVTEGDVIDYDTQSGIRLTGGMWSDPDHCYGYEGNLFFFEQGSWSETRFSPEGDLFGPLYFNADFVPQDDGPQFVQVILNSGSPGSEEAGIPESTGKIDIRASSRFYGGEVNSLMKTFRVISQENHFICGFRHLGLGEDVVIRGDTMFVRTGRSISYFDEFEARNLFFGPQIGWQSVFRCCAWSIIASSKVALGWMHQEVDINGATRIIDPHDGTDDTFPGGILAQPSNIGEHTTNRLAAVPEVTLRVNYDVTSNVQVFAAYNLIYINNSVRPGKQIDPFVDPSRIRGTADFDPSEEATRPAFDFRQGRFWAQGLNFGASCRW